MSGRRARQGATLEQRRQNRHAGINKLLRMPTNVHALPHILHEFRNVPARARLGGFGPLALPISSLAALLRFDTC